MSTSERNESPVVRFIDSFLQEKNIKWVLATGLLILLGSSLMMVTKGWTGFDPTIKFLVIMGYTAAIFIAGQWSYHHLALRKTGTVLMALTVLMIPATFVAWYWLWSLLPSAGGRAMSCGLLALNTGLAALYAHRTFAHFLRGNQTTFVVSFLLLSFAGAVAPALASAPPVLSWVGAFVLWAIFSIGVVKVNRHVFWLMEEHRQPRIFGFFPIVLLGGQFLLVSAANFAMHIPADWFGLACVLVAVPVLLTADSVARVFQERTGDIVRPIPWPLMLPLCVGVVLCASGVVLAASKLATGVPYAIVPTAALASVMMGVVARRTNRTAFVWAMLAGVLLSYNFSPVFFQDLARSAIEQGAHAVKETRLPYAFYGLTYLPLIIGSLSVAVWTKSRGNEFYSRPLRQFVVGLSTLLLLVAFGHEKALFPVSLLMMTLFASMAFLFGDRRLAVPGFAALMIAAAAAVPFVRSGWSIDPAADWYYLVPLGAATLLLMISPGLDRALRCLPLPGKALANSQLVQAPSLIFSYATTILMAATILTSSPWLSKFVGVPTTGVTFLPSAIIAGLLIAHSLVWVRSSTSWACVAFVVVEGIHFGFETGLSVWVQASLASVIGLSMWGATYVLERRAAWRISRAWSEVGRISTLIILTLTTCAFAIPAMLLEIIDFHWQPDALMWWPCYALLIVWCFDAARRMRQPVTTCLGCVGALVFVSWALVESFGNRIVEWLPLAWVLTGVAAVPVIELLRRTVADMNQRIVTVDAFRSVQVIAAPAGVITRGLLILFAGVSLFFYDVPLMAASGVAIAGLLAWSIARRDTRTTWALALLANWLVMVLAAHFATGHDHLWELVAKMLLPTLAASLTAVLAAASTLVWQMASRYCPQRRGLANGQIRLLRSVTAVGLAGTLLHATVSPMGIGLAVIAFVILAGSEFGFGCSRSDVRRVWSGLGLLTAAFAYVGWFDVLHFGSGLAMFLPFVIGGGLALAGTLARRWPRTELLSRPFLAVGLWMPLMTVGIAIGRHIMQGEDIVWKGLNSMALLGTSGYYFWHAVERRSKRFAVLSAAIVNVALMLLFRELHLADPQFYLIPIGVSVLILVEVLKREIPAVWHNPLRYAGALVILVSPTFHIIGDSWLPMLSLMISATGVLLVAIGLRVRALMYTGTAFLIADLIAMVVRGGIEHPNLLWIVGIGFGAAVLTLGAVLENNREKMLQRLRSISSQLEQWT